MHPDTRDGAKTKTELDREENGGAEVTERKGERGEVCVEGGVRR